MLTLEDFEDMLVSMQESGQTPRAINAELKNIIAAIPNYEEYEYDNMQANIDAGIADALVNNSDDYITWEIDKPLDSRKFVQGKKWDIGIKGYLNNINIEEEVDKFIGDEKHYEGWYERMKVPFAYSVSGEGVGRQWSFKQPHLMCQEYTVRDDGSYTREPVVSMVFDREAYADSDYMASSYSDLYTNLISIIKLEGSKVERGIMYKAKDSKTLIPFIRNYLLAVGGIEY